MPIILTGNHTCEKCGRVFEWNYFEIIRQAIDSPQYTVEKLPEGKTLVHSCHHRGNGIYDIQVNCPHCDYDNHFSFKTIKAFG